MSMVALAVVLALEVLARAVGTAGPFSGLAADFAGPATGSEAKVAGLILALVCMPHRFRWTFAGAALTLEALVNAQRLVVGDSFYLGNGAVLALAAAAVYAWWRLVGKEREATLKAVGLGSLLILMGKAGGIWLVLSSMAHPKVLDDYVQLADQALGNPAWVLGQVVTSSSVLSIVLYVVYLNLPVGAAVIAFFQLRDSARRGFPRHHIVRSFLLIGLIGPVVYILFPVVGPTYAFGSEVPGAGWLDVWPNAIPTITEPVATFFDQAVPRNCMPSLHTAWAMAIFLHGWRGSRTSRVFGTLWLVATVGATLGFGFHYGIDVLAGMIFTLTLEAALIRSEQGWHRRRLLVIAMGTALFSAMLLATRFLALNLAAGGLLSTVLLLGAVIAAAMGYVAVDRRSVPQSTSPEPASRAVPPDLPR